MFDFCVFNSFFGKILGEGDETSLSSELSEEDLIFLKLGVEGIREILKLLLI